MFQTSTNCLLVSSKNLFWEITKFNISTRPVSQGSREFDDFPEENHLNEFAVQIRQSHGGGCWGLLAPNNKTK
jgi:hypothetical protein